MLDNFHSIIYSFNEKFQKSFPIKPFDVFNHSLVHWLDKGSKTFGGKNITLILFFSSSSSDGCNRTLFSKRIPFWGNFFFFRKLFTVITNFFMNHSRKMSLVNHEFFWELYFTGKDSMFKFLKALSFAAFSDHC